MSAKDDRNERERAALWLADTAERLDGRGAAITPARVIWAAVEEAVEGIEALPDRERRWLASGTRSANIAPVALGRAEALEIEALRAALPASVSGASQVGAPRPGRDEDRILGVLGWFRYAERAREPRRLQRAAFLLARKGDVAAVAEIYAPGRRQRGRQVAYEIRTRFCGYVLAGLRDDLDLAIAASGQVVLRSEIALRMKTSKGA